MVLQSQTRAQANRGGAFKGHAPKFLKIIGIYGSLVRGDKC